MVLTTTAATELENIANSVIKNSNGLKIWVFDGEMGVGKTTLIKKICQLLEVQDQVSSPTFSLVNEYHTEQSEILYHFDFYRLEDEQEAFDFGCEEYFDSGNICFLEWASRIPSLLPEEFYLVKIESDLLTDERKYILQTVAL